MKDFQDLPKKRIYWREGREETWDIYFFIDFCPVTFGRCRLLMLLSVIFPEEPNAM